MQPQKFQDLMQNSIESCLGKMAEKLNQNFDPDDPKSLRLLREFRSTLNTWKQWIKSAAAETFQTAKKAWQSGVNAKSSQKAGNATQKFQTMVDSLTFPVNEQTAELHRKLNQPSGLLCPAPAK